MTDIQASLGVTQMERANNIIDERQSIAKKYNQSLIGFNFFQLPIHGKIYKHGYQSYPCIFDIENVNINNISEINKDRNSFMEYLEANGISTRPATHAVHMLSYYRKKYDISAIDYPNAYLANESSISFPLFNGLTTKEQDYIIKKIGKYLD